MGVHYNLFQVTDLVKIGVLSVMSVHFPEAGSLAFHPEVEVKIATIMEWHCQFSFSALLVGVLNNELTCVNRTRSYN